MVNFDRNMELIDGLETEYLRMIYYEFNNYYNNVYSSYEYNRLCTIINGEKRVTVNGNDEFTYSKDQFILLEPNSTVHMEITKPTIAIVLELSDKLITNTKDKVNLDFNKDLILECINGPIPVIEDSNISTLINKIITVSNSSDNNKEFLIDLVAQEIMYNLLKKQLLRDSSKDISNQNIQYAIDLMKERLLDNITVSEISSSLNMSLANFSTKFKKATGVTPNTYLTNLKLLKAQELLKLKNVTEVSYVLGYENISHFINLYKKKFGVTPKQYSLNNNTILF